MDAVTARCMGFDSRLLKSVTQTSQKPESSPGYCSLPAQIKVHHQYNRLSETHRHALQPETMIYSWQGHLETDDFDPPEIITCTLSAAGKLEIHVRDRSSVSWVRVDYDYAGSHKMKSLELVQGDRYRWGMGNSCSRTGRSHHGSMLQSVTPCLMNTCKSLNYN